MRAVYGQTTPSDLSGSGKCTEHGQKNKMICNDVAQLVLNTFVMKSTLMIKNVWIVLSFCAMTGCIKPRNRVGDRVAWKPVYASPTDYRAIQSLPPRAISEAGKFVYAAGRVFLVEKGRGIHVVSYADPANPVKQGFIEIPGCYEVSWRAGHLIANNGPDLIALAFTNVTTVSVASRLPNVFRSIQEALSVPTDGLPGDYFECPDLSRGVVLRWEKGTVNDPECRVR